MKSESKTYTAKIIIGGIVSVMFCAVLFFGALTVVYADPGTVVTGASSTVTSSGQSLLFTPHYLPNIVQDAKGPADMIFFIYKYLMGLVGIIAVGVILYAGVLRTISADMGKIKKSTELIKSALMGIVLLFGAQVLFNTINPNIVDFPRIQNALQPKERFVPSVFTGSDIGLAPDATSTPGGTTQSGRDLYGGIPQMACAQGGYTFPNCGSGGSVNLATKIQACNDCVGSAGNSFTTASNACFGATGRPVGCFQNKALVDTLNKLHGITAGWLVTGSYPPGANHSDPCHWNGTCVDIALGGFGGPTAAKVDTFIKAAQAAGLTVVNEYNVGTVVKPTSYSTTTGGHLHVHL